ncbi:hypothetical protein [Beggiatoa leptomitoformis]|uniref:Uncharacterized protein n=1 Tax=Beggiatoa leptomitoformis TaxID=288004 RepID=A0A2N9YIP6_9GAMM|nr:hypothetical protein [Beggiatoa leptomitoformis]ALG67431.2 hypothetical protein AL038_06600 [Beggiatoa leptomitoformis]AUI70353.2 hypothetical protein BLE401_17705 [Beggiatoa leptomitoformis]
MMKRLSTWYWRGLRFTASLLLLWLSHTVLANGGFGGDDTSPIPSLSLNQLSVPADLIRPPYRISTDNALWGKADLTEVGTIYANNDITGRIDFLISGIRNDMAMDVYLAYSTRPGSTDLWISSVAGRMELDPLTLEIVAVVRLQPAIRFYERTTPLGNAVITTQSTVISVNLSDLRLPQLQGNELFFQALAVKSDSLDFADSQASELDEFIIDRSNQSNRLKQ